VLAVDQPSVLQFWYRQSPRTLLSNAWTARVSPNNPPVVESGMAGVRFDMQGRLLAFYAVTPQVETAKRPAPSADWSVFFSSAGLDPARLRPAEPEWTPPFYSDARAAWVGTYPERPDIPIRLEAAAYRGRPVSFQIVAPWTRPDRMRPIRLSSGMNAPPITAGAIFLSLLAIGGFLARRHLIAGRGDRAGAFRLAAYTVASGLLAWILYADHVADFNAELGLAVRGLGTILVLALVIWVLYLAVEPYVRRRWPHALISWTRVLGGSFGDPRVGGDILIGVAAGATMAVCLAVIFRLPGLIGQPAPQPLWEGLDSLLGARVAAAEVIFGQVDAATLGMSVLLMVLLLRRVMPEWLAVVVTVLLTSIPHSLQSDLPLVVTLPMNAALLALPAAMLLRFGLLAAITSVYVMDQLAVNFPFGPTLGGWMSGPAPLLLFVLGGLAVFGFRAATSGRERRARG
jgi:hypothetical protein